RGPGSPRNALLARRIGDWCAAARFVRRLVRFFSVHYLWRLLGNISIRGIIVGSSLSRRVVYSIGRRGLFLLPCDRIPIPEVRCLVESGRPAVPAPATKRATKLRGAKARPRYRLS